MVSQEEQRCVCASAPSEIFRGLVQEWTGHHHWVPSNGGVMRSQVFLLRNLYSWWPKSSWQGDTIWHLLVVRDDHSVPATLWPNVSPSERYPALFRWEAFENSLCYHSTIGGLPNVFLGGPVANDMPWPSAQRALLGKAALSCHRSLSLWSVRWPDLFLATLNCDTEEKHGIWVVLRRGFFWCCQRFWIFGERNAK